MHKILLICLLIASASCYTNKYETGKSFDIIIESHNDEINSYNMGTAIVRCIDYIYYHSNITDHTIGTSLDTDMLDKYILWSKYIGNSISSLNEQNHAQFMMIQDLQADLLVKNFIIDNNRTIPCNTMKTYSDTGNFTSCKNDATLQELNNELMINNTKLTTIIDDLYNTVDQILQYYELQTLEHNDAISKMNATKCKSNIPLYTMIILAATVIVLLLIH